MPDQAHWTLEAVRALEPATTALVCTASVRARVQELLGQTARTGLDDVPPDARVLVVAGGGALLDAAKIFRADVRPDLQLLAIPTVWGSGSECTRIAVLARDGMKVARVEDALLPDGVLILPELAAQLPAALAASGRGDAWSHAYEAFLSPLATPALRAQLAALMGEMLATGLRDDPAWYTHAGRAGALQQQASVGLVHGIAHSLEVPLAATDVPLGHAALCSLFLAPVHRLNQERSGKWLTLAAEHGVDAEAVAATFADLHDHARYRAVLPVLQSRWQAVLQEPSTRTNSVLVRRADLAFFDALA